MRRNDLASETTGASQLSKESKQRSAMGGNVMKRVKGWLVAAAAAAMLASGSVPALAQTGKKVVRIHTAGPNDINVDNTMLAWLFANYVNTHSDTIEVKLFPNSQLGQTREVIEAMRLGSGASGTTGGPAEYASFVKRLGVLGLPFIWKNYDHAAATLDGPVGQELAQDMEKAGFKVLSWSVSWGYRNIVTAKKEVTNAADLKGLKIRTIPTKVFVAALNAMGANATPMNFGEIYTSLQSGVLDGFEHTVATVISFKFNEVVCCIALTKHLMDPTFLVLSLTEWKKFTPQEQEALQRGASLGAEIVRAMAPRREAEALAAVRKLGVKVNEIDLEPLVAAAVSAQNDLAKELGAEALLARIRAQ
jgi:TRAP-type transport system periplasmic protein